MNAKLSSSFRVQVGGRCCREGVLCNLPINVNSIIIRPPQDVDNLLLVLGNAALAPELRRSAADQLLGLAAASREPILLDAMTSGEAINTIAAAASPSSSSFSDHFDIQLPMACINLLYVLSCLVPKGRHWLGAADGGQHLLRRMVLPMLFSPLISARRAAARATAAVLLGGQADKWSGWASACADVTAESWETALEGGQQRRPPLLCLPEAFSAGYLLPCSVTWVKLEGRGTGPRNSQQGNLQLPDGPGIRKAPLLQGLVSEQRFLVQILVEERRLLRQLRRPETRAASLGASAYGGGKGGLLDLILDHPGTHDLPPIAAQACAANARALDLTARAAEVASALSAATSHSEAAQVLTAAGQLAATARGASALAACPGWCSALEPLLGACPATEEDRELWASLMPIVQRVLSAGIPQAAGTFRPHNKEHLAQLYVHLALCLAQSAPALLSAPGATCLPRTIPLALAGSGATVHRPSPMDSSTGSRLEEDSSSGVRGQRLVVELTLATLQVLAALIR